MIETVVTAGILIPGAGEPIRDGAVLVHDRQITYVGTFADVQQAAAPDANVIRYPASSTLLPGLIDAHVRLVLSGGTAPYQEFSALDLDSAERRRDYRDGPMSARSRQSLAAGVTTVRDIGDSHGLSIELGKAIAEGTTAGPRVVAAGPPLTTPDGDGWFLGGVVDDDDAIRQAIASRVAAGASLICYHDSGGFLKLTPRTPPFSWDTQFKPEQVALLVNESHRHGLPVAAHVFSREGIAHAVAAGVDTIEHCYWTVGQERYDRDPAVADAMAEQGIIACLPTNSNREHMIERVGEERARELWYGRYAWLDARGVRLAAGSSAGSTTSGFNDIVGCLETYAWLEFSPEKILETATRNAAAALGLDKITGSLLPGYSADLLVVDGNPLVDLQALRRTQFVMAAGRVADAVG